MYERVPIKRLFLETQLIFMLAFFILLIQQSIYFILLSTFVLLQNKVILDVGAGSGILSFFAVQAGAAKVYAIEASNMAQYAQQLVESNNVQDKIFVMHLKEIDLREKGDVIIS